MKYKTLIVALLCTILIGVVHSIVTAETNHPQPPEKITLYLSEESRICTLTPEDYIIGRLFAECPEPIEPEALKAAACAISSTLLYRIENDEKAIFGADISDINDKFISPEAAMHEHDDSYKEMLALYKSAAQYGCTHIMLYDEKPVLAPLCRLSAGITDKGEHPWLDSVSTPRDISNSEYLASSAFNAEQVRLALKTLCPDVKLDSDYASWFTEPEYLESGTLASIRFGGQKISGAQLAEILNLRSNAINIEYSEERFVFTTKGIGCNIGMSLNSADKLALLGKTADEILNYFYADISITNTKGR